MMKAEHPESRSMGRKRLARPMSRRVNRRHAMGLRFESLECRRLLAGDDPTVDPFPDELLNATVLGRKWEDVNGDGTPGDNEPGLGGVRIYADLDLNGRWTADEPSTLTMRDIPETDFDEAGLYSLNVPAGDHLIREVVPEGFRQTFPQRVDWPDPPPPTGDEFAHVEPPRLEIPFGQGDVFDAEVSITILPTCIRPIELTVMSGNPDVEVENLSGTQLNGCGGDTSQFQLLIHSAARIPQFEILFVDEVGNEYGSIPVYNREMNNTSGGHWVSLGPNSGVDGIDFGNARLGGGTVEGTKWLDRNGNGERDADEPGLAGVTIYADLNQNMQWDAGEPRAITSRDIPETDFDEGGRYALYGLPPGESMIREIVPNNYRQTFPGPGAQILSSDAAQMNPGIAIDLQLTGLGFEVSDAATLNNVTAQLDMTVVWPDSCGAIIEDATSQTVVGDHIVISMTGHQVGDACAEVISPQTVSLRVSDLHQGNYHVVTVLNEFVSDAADDIATWTNASEIELGVAGFHWVDVTDGGVVSDIDFGNQSTLLPGSISGTKWLDANGNAERDADELGLAGVTVYVDLNFNQVFDEGEPFAITQDDNPDTPANELGTYRIADIDPGTYWVGEVVPDGYVQTYPLGFWLPPWGPETDWIWPPDIGMHSVSVPSGETVERVDFGNQILKPASVSGTKWLDADGNQQRSDDEVGIAGVTIYADLNWNLQFDPDEPSAVTQDDDSATDVDESGWYTIEGLYPGNYLIREVIPAGYEQTYPLSDIAFPTDLPPDAPWFGPIDGAHYVFLENGAELTGVDFGNRPLPEAGSAAGWTWIDVNGDGEWNADERGLAGVTIYSDLNGNGFWDRNEPSTQSVADNPDTDFDESGHYLLSNLRPGQHTLRQVPPADMEATYPTPNPITLDIEQLPINPAHALDFRLTGFETTVAASGQMLGELTFDVTWPNGCGSVLDGATEAKWDGDIIFVSITGTQVGDVCTMALRTDTVTVFVEGMNPDANTGYIEAILNELSPETGEQVESWAVKAFWRQAGQGGHVVSVASGETVGDVNFGSRERELEKPTTPGDMADMNHDGQLSIDDIDALAAAVRDGTTQVENHDLTGDGAVNDADYRYLVEDLMQARYGDADMNGRFDSSDLVKVFQYGQYEDNLANNSTWASGDWNGDGEFSTSDLVLAFQHGGYESPVAANGLSSSLQTAADLLGAALAEDKLGRRF